MRGKLGTVVPLVVAVMAGLSGSAAGGDQAVTRPRSAKVAQCTDAAIREVRFAHDIAVDEIRVEVHKPSGPVMVSLSAGRWNRKLPVPTVSARGGTPGLRFTPALTGDRFEVALDPSFDAPGGACVTRVLLLARGQVVASVTP